MLATEVETTRGGLDLSSLPARCTAFGGCGWEGTPTYIDGKPSTHCPSCESEYDGITAELDDEARRHSLPRVGRNEPCPCGSGKKSKRCCYR